MMEDRSGYPRETKGGVPQKWFLTERERKLIDDLYDGSKEHTEILQRHMPHIPRKVIQRFAMNMGKTRPRGHWSPEQEDFLRKNLRKLSMKELQRQLRKHKATIVRKATSMGLYREDDGDGYTLADIMLGLGVSSNHQIYGWINKGWLKGKKVIVALKLEQWYFSNKSLKDFILAHPDQLNQHKFDWLWVADVLAGKNGIGRLDEETYAERTN